jgi:phosphatidate cytidylyltransferase
MPKTMLQQRILSAIIFVPICLLAVFLGGWFFLITVAAIFGIGAWEFWHMFKNANYSPNRLLIISGTICLALSRVVLNQDMSGLILSVFVLASLAAHVYAYDHGVETAGLDFCFTVGGVIYVGWLGSYVMALRFLPDGLYWVLLAILGVSMSDIGAYFLGTLLGRHKVSRRVSPAKSLEGYIGGILTACLFGYLFGSLTAPHSTFINANNGILLTLVVSSFSLLGDLGESLLKRQFNLKDSSQLIPGHGGMLDRIDTWLWAGVISYYLITWFWI